MGFLQNLLYGREIQRYERLIETAPEGHAFLRLIQLYQETDQHEKARETALRGAEMFPDDVALGKAGEDARKIKREAEKKRILGKLDQYPSPLLYARLGEIHLEEDNLEAAHSVCRKGIKDYADYGGLWTVLAKIALREHDRERALEYLQRATTLDQYNYGALMLLAETYLRAGERALARQALEKVLSFAPGDTEANHWLKDFDHRAAMLEEAGRGEALPEAIRPKGETIVMAEKRVPVEAPERQASASPPPTEAAPHKTQEKHSSGVGTSLGTEIRQIRRVEGVHGTILIDPYGLVIASDLPQGVDEELTAALITNLYRSVTEGSKDLLIGSFEDGVVSTTGGSIHLLGLDQMTMGVIASPETKTGLLHRAIRIFAERVLDLHH